MSIKELLTHVRDLLELGSFPGSVSEYVVLSKQGISQLIEAQNEIEKRTGDNVGVRSEEDTAGLASSGVPDTKRKGRKRGSK